MNPAVRAPFDVVDLGGMSYGDALQEQEVRFQAMLEAKRKASPLPNSTFLLVEHTPVYTLGKSGDLNNLRRKPEEVGAEFYKTTRGGDITYHGPGQIVGYPIFDLERFEMGVAKYIWSMERTRSQDLRNRREGESLCDHAWICLQREYRLKILRAHHSLWNRRQGRDFDGERTGSSSRF